MTKSIFLFILSLAIVCLCSCKKYLDKIPDNSLSIPSSLREYRQLLDNTLMFEQAVPGISDFGSDDIYLVPSVLQAANPEIRNSYTWEKDIYEGQPARDWNDAYQVVYYANIVLDGLKKIEVTPANLAEYNAIKGDALFYRALEFFFIEETYGQPYRKNSSLADPGIPLRLNSDLNEKSQRAPVAEVYNQIVGDLLEAKELVPVPVQLNNRNRSSRPAVFALLSRVSLSMQDYAKAGEYADSCLKLYNKLIHYNTLTATASFPFNPIIDEVIVNISLLSKMTRPPVDTSLYKLYHINDLRRTVFFADNATTGTKDFKGSYSAKSYLFGGIATDEMYLNRAESYARAGNTTQAMNDLNTLLSKRWKTGTYSDMSAPNAAAALQLILTERRKELLFRGIRWSDLRRLNQDPQTEKVLTRVANSKTYTLSPGDKRYAYPIPDNVIRLTGMEQNLR